MTSLKGDLRSIMGTPFGGVGHAVLIFSRVTRAAFNSDSVVLQLHDRIEMPEEADGKFQVDGLDPGPIRIELEGGTVHNHGWNIDLPDEGVWSLTDLVDAQVDWSPAVIGRAEAAAREAREHADRAEAGADRVGTAEQVGVWASEASSSASDAASARSGAVTARNAAQSARDAAEGHASRAATSESNAKTSETNAKQSETNAGDYAAVATTAATEAVDAMDSVSDIIGAKYATQEYVDGGLALKADKTYVDENKFNRGNIPAPSAGGDANLLDLLGAYNFTNASMPNTPTGIGTILNLPIGSAKTQLFVNWNTPALHIRRQSTSGSWTDWVKFASMSDLANLATKSELANFATKDELAAIGGSSPRSVSGTKIVPLSITAPGTTKLEAANSGAVRWVRKWAHMPKRVRVHISNWHPANNQGGGGNIAIYGRLGAADEQGNFRRSSLIFNSKVIPGDKTELVSPWVTVGANEGEHLGLTIGWTGMSGDMYMMQGGGWRKDTNSGWSTLPLDDTWTWAQETPFYVWIEAEVPTTAPVVMVNGDSISIGTASSNPVTDGWASVYAREQNALPVLFSQHGSSMTSWKTTSNRWNNLYPGADVRPDAIITALGQNDLGAAGMNLDTLQTRYEAVRQSYVDRWPDVPVYIAGVTPSTKSSAVEVIRRDFNTWLATYPFGERGFFDFSAAVGSADDEALAPEYSADGLHPNTAGQQVLGELVASHPVTPYVATEQQLKTLKAVGEHE